MRWLFSSGSRIARALPAAKWRAERGRSLSGETKGTDKDYDVVIVGAGMVGAALASCLGTSDLTASLKVALLDAKEPPRKKHAALDAVPEMRVSTLTPATVQLLERCGAWGSLAPPHSAHVEHMQVWDYESGGCLRWSARQVGHENMGYVAENSLIQSALIDTVEGNPNIDCFYPVSIASMTLPQGVSQGHGTAADDLAVVRLDGGDEIRARLVVGADGAASKVRSLAGIQSSIRDYNRRGLVATVEVSEPNTTAWQRFLPTGPFALLPVRNDLFNIVWSTTSEVASAMESTTAEAAIQAFNEALHGGPSHSSSIRSSDLDAFHTPPKITAIAGSMPRSFPLKRQLADKCMSLESSKV